MDTEIVPHSILYICIIITMFYLLFIFYDPSILYTDYATGSQSGPLSQDPGAEGRVNPGQYASQLQSTITSTHTYTL